VLGDTLDLIAGEKSGIIKDEVPVILGPTVTQDIVYETAKKRNSKVI
jgi:folylpolyglutamate synthase/dihydropteroate synthase